MLKGLATVNSDTTRVGLQPERTPNALTPFNQGVYGGVGIRFGTVRERSFFTRISTFDELNEELISPKYICASPKNAKIIMNFHQSGDTAVITHFKRNYRESEGN